MNKPVSRRKFLVRGGLGTLGVLAVGTYLGRNPLRRAILKTVETAPPFYQGQGTEPQLWFELTKENTLVFHSPKVEMGQGAFTSFAQIIHDEMDVDIDQIRVVGAATSTGVIDGLSTGGSLSVGGLWQPLRELSATMREMLKKQAADQWGVTPGEVNTGSGMLSSGEKKMTYAEAATGVTDWEIPKTPELRPVKDYRLVGTPVPRIDLEEKVFGTAPFGLDAEMPDMLHAAIVRPSAVGARMVGVDSSKAEQMPGVVKVCRIDDWVGVVAQTYSQALAARQALQVEWDIPRKWTEEDLRDMLQVGKGRRMITQKVGGHLDTEEDRVETLEFTTPLGAHAQLEPNGAVVHYRDGKVQVILSTQVPGQTRRQVAKALDLDEEDVDIVPTYLGGGFGRRLNTSHAVQVAQLSREVGRPVKYIFTRKDEFQHDTFRPPTHHIMKGKLDPGGRLHHLEHHYASGDVAHGSPMFPKAMTAIIGTDVGAARGGNLMYGNIPNKRAVQWHTSLPFATSWWRSLGLLANTFAIESFMDEMAVKTGQDPVQFRLAHLGDSNGQERIRNVILMAAEKAGYEDGVKDGRAMGFAASIDTNAPCAQVAEVSIEDNEIRVHKVTCAFDCGIAVNPDQVRAQCEGSIIMGLSATLYEKMTLRDGELYPIIYGPYQMAQLKHAPREIDVHLIQGADIPLPVGEPPLGPIGAAIANAVKRLTGKRLTDIPLSL